MRKEERKSTGERGGAAWALALAFVLVSSGCGPPPGVESAKDGPTSARPVDPLPVGSESNAFVSSELIEHLPAESCRACHSEIVEAWERSHHAHALRLIDDSIDAGAFVPDTLHLEVTLTTSVSRSMSGYRVRQEGPNGFTFSGAPAAVLGYTPLVQYLVSFPGGRWQVLDPAYDPHSNQWFSVYENQDRRPDEWGFWANRGMNWNSQCAYCHTTSFKKNYDQATDTYRSSWAELGVTCTQCHAPREHGTTSPGGCTVDTTTYTNTVHMETCASCHSRREELTDGMPPTTSYDDHYLLVLPDLPGLYYADGQVLEEDYVYGSFVMSRMHLKGVTCMDCHDAHSGELRLPTENNALCMQCHAPPGRLDAKIIDMLEHSHHKFGTAGSLCVDCHMPITKYMVRDPRHDHGFTSPDPQLTIEHGIPNACNRCHADKTSEWSVGYMQEWYGTNMHRRARERTRLVARAYEGDPTAAPGLLRLAETEEIPAWRATLLSLAAQVLPGPATHPALVNALTNAHPLVRRAALRGLRGQPDAARYVAPLLNDPSRSVRVEAAMTMAGGLQGPERAHQEVLAWLDQVSDQPGGAARQAEWALAEGRHDDAQAWADRVVKWDHAGAGTHAMRAQVYYRGGRLDEAEASFKEAMRLEPDYAYHPYSLALLYGELGRNADVIAMLERAVALDPDFDRAWYNLGLAHAQREELDKAITALRKAEEAGPGIPDYSYARATVHLRKGEPEEAKAAAAISLEIAPGYIPALRLMRSIP